MVPKIIGGTESCQFDGDPRLAAQTANYYKESMGQGRSWTRGESWKARASGSIDFAPEFQKQHSGRGPGAADEAQTIAEALAHVRKTIADPGVKITPLPIQAEPSTVSDVRSSSFHAVQRAIRQTIPDALVAPALLVAATDSRHFAPLTQNIFRFLPITLGAEDTGRYHGIDERISLEDYERCIRFYAQLIRNSQAS